MSLTTPKPGTDTTSLETTQLPDFPTLSLSPADQQKLGEWWRTVRDVLRRMEERLKESS